MATEKMQEVRDQYKNLQENPKEDNGSLTKVISVTLGNLENHLKEVDKKLEDVGDQWTEMLFNEDLKERSFKKLIKHNQSIQDQHDVFTRKSTEVIAYLSQFEHLIDSLSGFPFFSGMKSQFSAIKEDINHSRKEIEKYSQAIEQAKEEEVWPDVSKIHVNDVVERTRDVKQSSSDIFECLFQLDIMLKYFQSKRKSFGDFALSEMLASREQRVEMLEYVVGRIKESIEAML